LKKVGTALCILGAILLAFVAFQLWGTSFSEHSAQTRLKTEFSAQLNAHSSTPRTSTPPTSSSPTTSTAQGDTSGGDVLQTQGGSDGTSTGSVAAGSPIGLLTIVRIGMVDDVIIEGVDDADLRQGPGHYPGTPLPGQAGNAAIAGHRTTYAAPFYNLDQLRTGDPIVVRTIAGTFHYAVTRTMIVVPTDSSVLDDTAVSELTLTTCNPRYSAAQRLVVVALLQSSRLAGVAQPPHHRGPSRTSATSTASTSSLGAGGGGSGVAGVVLWGLLAAIVGFFVALIWRRSKYRVPRWTTALVGVPGIFVTMFVFFGHLSTLLPASF
jgi:sortase A